MSKTRKPQRRTFRYWLQQLHLWIGLILLLPLVMMGITGAVLVYAHDIEHLLGQGEPAGQDGRRLALAGRADRSGARGLQRSDPHSDCRALADRGRASPRRCACRGPAWRASARSSAAAEQGRAGTKAACRRKARSPAACRS